MRPPALACKAAVQIGFNGWVLHDFLLLSLPDLHASAGGRTNPCLPTIFSSQALSKGCRHFWGSWATQVCTDDDAPLVKYLRPLIDDGISAVRKNNKISAHDAAMEKMGLTEAHKPFIVMIGNNLSRDVAGAHPDGNTSPSLR